MRRIFYFFNFLMMTGVPPLNIWKIEEQGRVNPLIQASQLQEVYVKDRVAQALTISNITMKELEGRLRNEKYRLVRNEKGWPRGIRGDTDEYDVMIVSLVDASGKVVVEEIALLSKLTWTVGENMLSMVSRNKCIRVPKSSPIRLQLYDIHQTVYLINPDGKTIRSTHFTKI